MRKQMKGYGFYLVIIGIVLLTIFLSDSFDMRETMHIIIISFR